MVLQNQFNRLIIIKYFICGRSTSGRKQIPLLFCIDHVHNGHANDAIISFLMDIMIMANKTQCMKFHFQRKYFVSTKLFEIKLSMKRTTVLSSPRRENDHVIYISWWENKKWKQFCQMIDLRQKRLTYLWWSYFFRWKIEQFVNTMCVIALHFSFNFF